MSKKVKLDHLLYLLHQGALPDKHRKIVNKKGQFGPADKIEPPTRQESPPPGLANCVVH